MNTPIKISLRSEWLPILMLLASAVASFYFYAHFPDQVPTHWDFNGTINGYSGKAFAAFFFPALNLGMYLFFLVLPALDPKKQRYEEFANVYNFFKNLILGLLTIVYFIIGFAGMGFTIPVGLIMPVLVGLLFILMGNYMGKIKRNWFMGARTPWTISNEDIWNKTNRLSGKLFVLGGFIFILIPFLPAFWAIPLFIGTIILLVVVPFVYSAYLFKTGKKD